MHQDCHAILERRAGTARGQPRLVVGATDGSESLRLLKAGGIVELEDEYELAMFIDAAPGRAQQSNKCALIRLALPAHTPQVYPNA